jgi:hypothetical protein
MRPGKRDDFIAETCCECAQSPSDVMLAHLLDVVMLFLADGYRATGLRKDLLAYM